LKARVEHGLVGPFAVVRHCAKPGGSEVSGAFLAVVRTWVQRRTPDGWRGSIEVYFTQGVPGVIKVVSLLYDNA
jgi:hypothetical protein